MDSTVGVALLGVETRFEALVKEVCKSTQSWSGRIVDAKAIVTMKWHENDRRLQTESSHAVVYIG